MSGQNKSHDHNLTLLIIELKLSANTKITLKRTLSGWNKNPNFLPVRREGGGLFTSNSEEYPDFA